MKIGEGIRLQSNDVLFASPHQLIVFSFLPKLLFPHLVQQKSQHRTLFTIVSAEYLSITFQDTPSHDLLHIRHPSPIFKHLIQQYVFVVFNLQPSPAGVITSCAYSVGRKKGHWEQGIQVLLIEGMIRDDWGWRLYYFDFDLFVCIDASKVVGLLEISFSQSFLLLRLGVSEIILAYCFNLGQFMYFFSRLVLVLAVSESEVPLEIGERFGGFAMRIHEQLVWLFIDSTKVALSLCGARSLAHASFQPTDLQSIDGDEVSQFGEDGVDDFLFCEACGLDWVILEVDDLQVFKMRQLVEDMSGDGDLIVINDEYFEIGEVVHAFYELYLVVRAIHAVQMIIIFTFSMRILIFESNIRLEVKFKIIQQIVTHIDLFQQIGMLYKIQIRQLIVGAIQYLY